MRPEVRMGGCTARDRTSSAGSRIPPSPPFKDHLRCRGVRSRDNIYADLVFIIVVHACYNGEVSERLKEADSKSVVPFTRNRGFKSLPLRHLKTSEFAEGFEAAQRSTGS